MAVLFGTFSIYWKEGDSDVVLQLVKSKNKFNESKGENLKKYGKTQLRWIL